MKTKKKLLAGLLALLLLLAAFVVLRMTEKEEPQQESSAEGTEATLYQTEQEAISEIKIENRSGTVEIVKEKGSYVLKGMEDYGQSQTQMNVLVRNLSELTGTVVQESEVEKERYGFDDPTLIEITAEETVSLQLGDYNEGGGCWYLMREGDETLYTVPAGKGNLIEASAYSYLSRTFIDAYTDGEEITERLRRIVIERPDLDAPLEIVAIDEEPQAYTSSYELVSPIHVKTSVKAMNEKIGALFGFSAAEVLGPYEETQAQKYGFDDPVMVMTVEHDGVTDTFTVGAEAEEGVRYLLWSGSDLLYTVNETSLSFLHEDVDSLFFSMALLPQIDTVSEVELTIDGETTTFVLERDEQGEISKITENGQTLNEKLFRTFYSFLLEVDVQEIYTEPVEGEAELSITYRYLDGGEDRLEMVPLGDARNGGILVNGEPSFKGRLAYVEKLKTELSHLRSGEAIDTNW